MSQQRQGVARLDECDDLGVLEQLLELRIVSQPTQSWTDFAEHLSRGPPELGGICSGRLVHQAQFREPRAHRVVVGDREEARPIHRRVHRAVFYVRPEDRILPERANARILHQGLHFRDGGPGPRDHPCGKAAARPAHGGRHPLLDQ